MKKWLSVFLSILGKKEFETKDGKSVLTEDQKAKLTASFSAEMVTKLEAYLAKGEEEGTDEDVTAALVQGITTQMNANQAAMQAKIDALVAKNGGLEATVTQLMNSDEPEAIPEMDKNITRKANVPSVMRVDMRKNHYAKVGEFLKTGVNSAAYNATTIDVADLRAEFGTYLNNQRNLDIVRQILAGFTSAKYMTTVLAVTEWRATEALITSVVQQFTPEWTPLGKGKFRPLVIKNKRHKINVPIKPVEVLDSYLFYLYDEGLAPDQMPITKYITEVLVKPRMLQDLEMRMVFKGKYVEKAWGDVTANDPGTKPEESMDGFETILVDSKALAGGANDTYINYFTQTINWKTATDQQVLDFINAFVDWINPLYQTDMMPVFCSLDVYKRYKRAYKKIWGAGSGTEKTSFGEDVIDYSMNTLVPLAGMYKSPILFSTPKENFIKLRHKNEVPNIINDVQKADYVVKLFGEFWLGVGFAIGDAVFAYVPEGYNPNGAVTAKWGAATDYNKYVMEEGSEDFGGL
tara:strand:+ start:9105 stop:10664 length:1560 start_codon:yes stop_codon:yes gene_type:complete